MCCPQAKSEAGREQSWCYGVRGYEESSPLPRGVPVTSQRWEQPCPTWKEGNQLSHSLVACRAALYHEAGGKPSSPGTQPRE